MKFLGPDFKEQTPESFHAYAKDVHKFQNIKRPEASKPKLKKTRKKQTPNGKLKSDSRSEPSPNTLGSPEKDAENQQDAGWSDPSGNQFLLTVPN